MLSANVIRIFKSTIFSDQINETVSFFCMLIQIHKNQKLIENCLVRHDQNMGMVNLVSGL